MQPALPRTAMNRFVKQTSPFCWLYVVSHPNAPSPVKIGITERPVSRMKELGSPSILARVPVMKPRGKEHCCTTASLRSECHRPSTSNWMSNNWNLC